MAHNRETTRARWHSRGGFLSTTLLVLLALGAPFMVTQGLIAHGALFLPAVLGLMLLLGGPLVRVALATGRMDHRLQGREALHMVQLLVRLALALGLLALAVRAAGWILAEVWFGVPANALDFRDRELTVSSTAWHTASLPGMWVGAAAVLALTAGLTALAWRRRLAGLSWIAGWVLLLAVVLIALGVVLGLSLPGAGALAAMVAPLDWRAPLGLAFWGDAAAIALLGLGGQAALLAAAGRGLPQRARIGREARVVVGGISLLTVLGGLVGLLLLCALSVRLGLIPTVEHATPVVLVLELVPALGMQMFSGWPPELRPSERQIALAWCFIVALTCAIGAAALLVARRWTPRPLTSRAAWFGYAAALVAVGAVATGHLIGLRAAWLPLIIVMPTLLAIMNLTVTRRAGPDMRVVAAAFESSRPWLEKAGIVFAFQVARPLLLLLVTAIALSKPEYGLVLGGFALSFALMWVGSLRQRPRARDTGLLRVASVPLLLAAALPMVVNADATAAYERAFTVAESRSPAAAVADFERRWMRGESIDLERLRTDAALLVALAAEKEAPAQARRNARVALACLLLVDPFSEQSLRLERSMLAMDGLFPYSRLDEAVSDHMRGKPRPLIELLSGVDAALQQDSLGNALKHEPELAALLAALIHDMRQAYGTGGRDAQRLRVHLLNRAMTGRSLIKPRLGPGVVYIGCLLLAAFMLAAALVLSLREREPGA